jgi:hypothetical protein
MPDYAQAVQRIQRVPGVVSSVPVIEGQVLATARGQSLGAVVYGIRPEDLARRSLLNNSRLRGRIADLARDDAIVIGAKMAERFNLDIGGEVTLISPQGNETAFGTMPRLRTYRVVAIFEVGKGYGRDGDTSREWWRLGLALAGAREPAAWNRRADPADVDHAKGVVELLAERHQLRVRLSRNRHPPPQRDAASEERRGHAEGQDDR